MNTEEKAAISLQTGPQSPERGLHRGPAGGWTPASGAGGQEALPCYRRGSIRYWQEDAVDEARSRAMDKVVTIIEITSEYMRQMQAAPQLTANDLVRITGCWLISMTPF